jgi:UDP-2,4-diacetamido-2,4,6-trideoxy-beta-L-altropyranose hydrolase
MIEFSTVLFRADASLDMGSGHVMRCLTLAQELRALGAQCHFICREHPGNLCDVIEERDFKVHRLPLESEEAGPINDRQNYLDWLGASWQADAEACRVILSQHPPDCLVVDHYALDHRWEMSVMTGLSNIPRLLVIDDLANRHHIADLLLDQNLGRKEEDYQGLVPRACRLLVGPRYAMLRGEFREWRQTSLCRRAEQKELKRLLINLGGVDKDNVTGQILHTLTNCDLPRDLEIEVVMGASAPWRDLVAAQSENMLWPTHVAISAGDMARRMTEADLAIGAAGSTSWERCCLGLPTLLVVLAENQQISASALHTAGAAIYIGDADTCTERLKAELQKLTVKPSSLTEMAFASSAICDGFGARNIARTALNMMRVG